MYSLLVALWALLIELFYPSARVFYSRQKFSIQVQEGEEKRWGAKVSKVELLSLVLNKSIWTFCSINYRKQIKTNSSGWWWSKITLLLVQSKSHKKTSQYKAGIFESAAQIIRRLPLPTISADDASGGEETSITNRSSLAPPPWKSAYSAHPSLLKKCLMPSAGIINQRLNEASWAEQ